VVSAVLRRVSAVLSLVGFWTLQMAGLLSLGVTTAHAKPEGPTCEWGGGRYSRLGIGSIHCAGGRPPVALDGNRSRHMLAARRQDDRRPRNAASGRSVARERRWLPGERCVRSGSSLYDS